jgi:SAM-dependent methyltransferase
MERVGTFLAGLGIDQFLDIGTGILTWPNLHEVVQRTRPEAKFAYVDFDATVLRYAEAAVQQSNGRITFIHADARNPEEIIAQAREHLDFTRLIAVLAIALLHFISDKYEPGRIVRELVTPLPSGSYLALSQATSDQDPQAAATTEQIYR